MTTMNTKAVAMGAAAILAALIAGCGTSATTQSTPTAPSKPSATAPAPATPTAATIAQRLHLTTAAGYVAYTASTDPNHLLGRQGEYTSKVNWGANQDNSIEVFANLADAQARQQYLSAFRPPFGDGYDHIHGTALLRLSADLTPSQAHALEAQFDLAPG